MAIRTAGMISPKDRTKKYNSVKTAPTSALRAMLVTNSGLSETMKRRVRAEISSRGESAPAPKPMKANKGGNVKKKSKDDVTVISIGIGTMPKSKVDKMKKGMKPGGKANGKEHMYAAGGSVTDKLPNKGLKNLAKSTEGKEAVRKMGFDV
tara:strand:+ start:117 stop:569 length:453 start_codon:yes stop_codon:yes gene_type:complete